MNRPIQSAAEGMPKISRRTALASIAATIAAPATASETSSVALDGLLARHREAVAVADAAGERVRAIEDGPTLKVLPAVRVRLGDLPVYAKSEEAIERHFASKDPGRFISEQNRKLPKHVEARRRWQQERSAKLSEFRRLTAQEKALEDQSGLTAAMASAERAFAAMWSIEQQIIVYVPVSLAEAAQKAEWCVAAWGSSLRYHADGENALLNALTAIARAKP
ncbi:hypothetical protein P7F60_12205 [Rhizobium sp. YJ-22]|uniref:hypothetical protein n=1 Tax=Rhizobium sp. YJ-22 TaxID=3037556 RepID=UPI00241258CB|nr:hypothetical protein [Rhizobium sp. YJ-22]MDG3577155.1 hypothetical protein [Rhizobium sp. YJ-22]